MGGVSDGDGDGDNSGDTAEREADKSICFLDAGHKLTCGSSRRLGCARDTSHDVPSICNVMNWTRWCLVSMERIEMPGQWMEKYMREIRTTTS